VQGLLKENIENRMGVTKLYIDLLCNFLFYMIVKVEIESKSVILFSCENVCGFPVVYALFSGFVLQFTDNVHY
jgi:hypothetical protein